MKRQNQRAEVLKTAVHVLVLQYLQDMILIPQADTNQSHQGFQNTWSVRWSQYHPYCTLTSIILKLPAAVPVNVVPAAVIGQVVVVSTIVALAVVSVG